jgi:endonuclease G
VPPAQTVALRNALAELEAARAREYYNEPKDQQAREIYYTAIPADATPQELYSKLSALLKKTHKTLLPYEPATHVYPWVDLHESEPKPVLKSIYSGKALDPRQLIEEDSGSSRNAPACERC